MDTHLPNPLWTLEQLCAQAEALLTDLEQEAGRGRVRAIPDERTLRYYTTIGLLAGPALMKGRRAFYDRRHLAQIIAIKRLQATGMSLAQVQQELAGATPQEIEGMARLPQELPEPQARTFWREAAAPTPHPEEAPRLGTWLEPLPGLVLLLPPGSLPTGFAALTQAAKPLLAELLRQGLLPIQHTPGDDHV